MKIFTRMLKILLLSGIVLGTSGFAYSPDVFVIKAQTDNEGTSANNEFTIPINPSYDYDYGVDCDNDGTYEIKGRSDSVTCSYLITREPPPRTIAIKGTFPAIYFNNAGDREKILEVVQWGTQAWKSMSHAFHGAENLTVTAEDNPYLSNVSNMSYMFYGAHSLTNITSSNIVWNVSSVTDMSNMFTNTNIFNQNIGDWDVSIYII